MKITLRRSYRDSAPLTPLDVNITIRELAKIALNNSWDGADYGNPDAHARTLGRRLSGSPGLLPYLSNTVGLGYTTTARFNQGDETVDITLPLDNDQLEEGHSFVIAQIEAGRGYKIIGDTPPGGPCEDTNGFHHRGCGYESNIVYDNDSYEHWVKVVAVADTVDEGEDAVFKIERFATAAVASTENRCTLTNPESASQISSGLIDYRRLYYDVSGHETVQGPGFPQYLRIVHVPAANSETELRLPTSDDNADEPDASLVFSLQERIENTSTSYWWPYYCIVPDGGSATVVVRDNDNDDSGITVTPTTLTVAEGDSAKYEVVLDAAPSGNVTVAVSPKSGSDTDLTVDKPSLTFKPGDWSTAQEVWVSAAEDADALNGYATIEHTASGADYGVASTRTVTATESDNDEAGITINPMVLTVAEGDSVKYTVALDTQPSENVTVSISPGSNSDTDVTTDKTSLTFTPNDWSTAQEVWVKAAEDNDAINGTATIEFSVSGGDYNEMVIPSMTATESDNDAAGVTINPTALAVAEGDSVKYSVALTTQPSGDVTVAISLASGSDEDVTVSDESLTFTAETWSTAQEVWVKAAEDEDAVGGTATIEHSVSGGDYASVTASSVTATESDNDAAGVTVNPTALAVAEGDSVKYSVVLDTQPSADVTIAVSLAAGSDEDVTVSDESLTFTTETWSTAQDVWVKAAEDEDAVAGGTATIEHAVSGGDYNSVTASSVTATESDNDTAGVTVKPTTLAVTEGSNAKYTVVLDTKPSGDVTIDISLASGSDADITVSDESLTFTPETWSTAQEVTVSAAADNDAVRGAATIEHTASGGDYGSVSVASVTATELETGTQDAPKGIKVTPTALMVAEDDSVKYSVALTTQPSADVTIDISLASGSDADITVSDESLTFTPEAWSTAQDVWVKAAEDDDAVAGAATIEHAVSGGDYNNVTASSVTATESDNDAAGVTVNPTALAVAEGDSVKYSVVLDTQPSDDVTIAVSLAAGSDEDITVSDESLTFTAETWMTAQDVWVKAAEDEDAVAGTATIEHAVSGGDYNNVTASSVTATESDNDAAGVTVSPTALTVAEGDSVKYSVALKTKPSGNVTITPSLAAGSDEDVTVSDESLTFTSETWSTAQDVWVRAAEDDDASAGVATIEHSVSGGDYNSVTASSVTATESDNDAAGVTINPTALAVAEGDSVKYSVVLDTKPSADVTIAASLAAGSDEDVTVSDESLTFTTETWSTAQDVWVKAAEDDDAISGVATIEHSVSGGDYASVTASSVTATESDNDAAGVTVNPTALAVAEGDSVKYSVALKTKPSADVTIAASLAAGSDEDITVSDESLTFTTETWSTAQDVWVKAAEDDDAISGVATIEHSVSGGDYASVTASSVTATESDNDAAGVTVNPTALAVAEGDSVKYSVVLDTQPSDDVTIAVSLAAGSDEDITVSDESLTFTTETWSTAQDVWVKAAEDDDAVAGVATIEHSVSGGDYASVTASSVTATESDNDAAGVTVNPTALAVAEGDSVKYSVVLKTQPSDDVTIAVSLAAGSDEDITVSDESLTFTTETWSTAQDVWVKAAEDDDAVAGVATIEHSVSGGDYNSVTASSVTATESDNDTAGVTVKPTTLAVTEGSNAKYTVVLDTKPSGDVTIDISLASGSDADITVSDESLTFTPETWSTAQEVTVSAAADNDAVRGAATIEHTASGGDYGSVSVASVTATELETGTQDAPKGIKVTPTALMVAEDDSVKYSVALTTQPSADVTIDISLASGSDADITVSDESLTFTPEAWSTAQDVWVKAAEDDDAVAGTATIEHAVSGGDYNNVTASSVTATESDNDAAGVTVSPTALTVAEDDSVKYSVALDDAALGRRNDLRCLSLRVRTKTSQ